MKLHYFADAPNFGDALNPWLWPQLLGHRLDDDASRLFLGIGTILKADLPEAQSYHVLGAGAGYGAPPVLDARWKIYAVRGPRTAAALALPADRAITDGAYLLRTVALPELAPGPAIGFMPHFRAIPHTPWRLLCANLGLRYIDPFTPVPETIAAIRGCDCLITEAMHGAIVADACRVPWIPVVTGSHILDFKWRDWLESIELDCNPVPIANLRRITSHHNDDALLLALARRGANAAALAFQVLPLWRNLRTLLERLRRRITVPLLSRDAVIVNRTDRLRHQLDQLRKDCDSNR